MHKVLIASLLLIGCKKSEQAASHKAADKPAETPAATTPAAETPPVDTSKPGRPPDTSYGTCRVVATGALAFEQESPHTGGSMLNIFQWHSPEMRQNMKYPDEGMILNCLGKDVRLNVMTRPRVAFPMKPGTYGVGTADAGLFVTGQITKPGGDLSVTKSTGQVEITHFDDDRIAGKGTVTVQTMPDSGESKLEISFDLKCYGLSGCKK